jgi:hypothetical protein
MTGAGLPARCSPSVMISAATRASRRRADIVIRIVAEHELVARRPIAGDGRHRLDPDLVLRFVRHPHHPVR